jgi:hypothetical protein
MLCKPHDLCTRLPARRLLFSRYSVVVSATKYLDPSHARTGGEDLSVLTNRAEPVSKKPERIRQTAAVDSADALKSLNSIVPLMEGDASVSWARCGSCELQDRRNEKETCVAALTSRGHDRDVKGSRGGYALPVLLLLFGFLSNIIDASSQSHSRPARSCSMYAGYGPRDEELRRRSVTRRRRRWNLRVSERDVLIVGQPLQ